VNATGNRNKQIVVDNTAYTIDNTSSSGVRQITINNLAPGQHTLSLVRNNAASTKSSKTYFTVREGYDLNITVSTSGGISTAETRIAGVANNGNRPLTTAQFNRLYSQTKAKTSSSTRAKYLETQLNSSNRMMTAAQARQLIALVNSESSRLNLAKLAYSHVSDPGNYTVVTNLLSSSSNRDALNAYISTTSSAGYIDDVNSTSAMSDTRFRTIYNEVVAEPTSTDKSYYLNNFFGRDNNYYTSAQARQLIGLTSSEQDRFALAKAAYRGITDRENYTDVSSLLTSSSNRYALQTYINSYNNSSPTAAMTSANFDRLYNSVYNSSSATTRYNTINSAFTTQGNYFTVAQAKRLIPLVSSEANRLQLAKTAYRTLTDPANYLQFNDFLSSTASRNDFRNYVSSYELNTVNTGAGMSQTDYDNLYETVKNAWTSSSRVQSLSDAFNKSGNYFTTYQVSQLLSLISNENDRLPLAKTAYDNIVDVNNYSQLYALFNSTANRNDLANFASGMQNGTSTSVRVAMTESSFNELMSQIQLTFGFGAKYNSLTEIFNTETNYFTVAQAKQLIQQVSSEKNRLELAKSAYNNIVDPTNFSQIYDLLSSQSSKNELAAYVSSNAIN